MAFVLACFIIGLMAPRFAGGRYIVAMAVATTYLKFSFGFDFSQNAKAALMTIITLFVINCAILSASYLVGLGPFTEEPIRPWGAPSGCCIFP